MGPPNSSAPSTGITRRTFLRRTLAGAALLLVAGTFLRHLTGYRLPPREKPLRHLSDSEAVILSAVVARILSPPPESPPFGAPPANERFRDASPGAPSGAASTSLLAPPTPDSVDTLGQIDAYLSHLPPPAVADVRALLHLVEHSPPLFALRFARFTRLDGDAQDRILAGWESSRIEVRRLGFAALKRLAMLGYYGDPRTHALLGYVPMPLPQNNPGLLP